MNVLKTSLVTAALVAAGIPSANALTRKTADFGVQLVVQNACTINATAPLNFGTVTSDIAANIDATTVLRINCSKSAAYSIGLSDGDHLNVSQRRMANAGATDFVNYSLYLDASRLLPWRDIASSARYAGTGSGNDQDITVYGRVPGGQTAPAGTYNDIVTATIEF